MVLSLGNGLGFLFSNCFSCRTGIFLVGLSGSWGCAIFMFFSMISSKISDTWNNNNNPQEPPNQNIPSKVNPIYSYL